jgi:hypothetical protein
VFISEAASEVCAAWRDAFGALLEKVLRAEPDLVLRHAVIRGLLGIGVDWMDQGFSTPIDRIVDAATKIVSILERR